MPVFPSLNERDRQPEIMDQPGLDEKSHLQALRGLGRINRLSATADRFWSRIRPLAKNSPTPLSVLDVACGGGDIAISLAERAKREGCQMDVTGCDISPVALAHATQQADRRATAVRFLNRDVIAHGLDRDYDVIVSSLFLHHLDTRQTVELLSELSRRAQRRVLVSDLVRNQWGYFLAAVGGRILTRSRVVHVDGPLSVRAAFSIPEVKHLANQSRMSNATIQRCWPSRFLLQWDRKR